MGHKEQGGSKACLCHDSQLDQKAIERTADKRVQKQIDDAKPGRMFPWQTKEPVCPVVQREAPDRERPIKRIFGLSLPPVPPTEDPTQEPTQKPTLDDYDLLGEGSWCIIIFTLPPPPPGPRGGGGDGNLPPAKKI